MRTANRITFSQPEIADLIKAWLATSIAFAVFFSYGQFGEMNFVKFLFLIAIAAATAGVGFLGHELMHKVAAHRFGVQSEFRSHDMMLVIMILFAFLGIIFAAPGAVQIRGMITRRESGIISLAGPATNMALALLFLPLVYMGGVLGSIGGYGLFINAFLGAFNLIPFLGLDGEKILQWHKGWYFGALIVGAVLVVFAFVTVGGV